MSYKLASHIYTSVLILLCVTTVFCDDKPVVESTHGKIQGKVYRTLYKDTEYYGFLGIPYAAPPVKKLRFLPPQPVAPWETTLIATKEKNACAQFNNNRKKNQTFGFYGSEDCLYLDIFTPALDNSKRAVIFFIYNEHFLNSYNKTKDYQPDFFIEEDVVVVTISHRLTAFGFLSLEDETLWGNSGLKDIVQGIEWIRDNIEKFGGDPDRITLMGCQGGATAVDLLLHSKKKNLFKAAILQSGSSFASAYLQENVRQRAFELANLLHKTPVSSSTLLQELNEADVANITIKELHASPKDHFKDTQRSVVTFSPIVEKDPEGLIVDYPENSTEITTPILIGFNSHEGLDAAMHYYIEPRYVGFLKKDFPLLFPLRVKFSFDPKEDSFYDAVEEIKAFYFRKGINLKTVKDYKDYMADALTAYSVNHAARFYADISTKHLYFYYFAYHSDLNENTNNLMKMSTIDDPKRGAAAGDELCYLFKCPDLKEQYLEHNKINSEERKVQKTLVKMWTNFAKFENPTPADDDTLEGLQWPPYNNEEKQHLHIGKEFKIKRELYKNSIKFWDDFFERWSKKAVNGIVGKSINKKDEL